jgi:hypothetical protein
MNNQHPHPLDVAWGLVKKVPVDREWAAALCGLLATAHFST